MESIFIYGPPGSGKSALGCKLAQALALPFNDLDERIVAEAGMDIPAIFAAEGERGFRERESRALAQVIAAGQVVVALGGGALLDPQNRAGVEAAGSVLCLSASFETLLARSSAQQGQRPLLQGDIAARLEALLAERAAHYASFERQLAVEGLDLDGAAWAALVRLGRFRVSGMGAGYDVQVIPGGLARLGQALAAQELRGPVALVSDSNVGPLYALQALESLEKAGYKAHEIVIPAGEAHKHVQTVMHLWEGFLEAGLERGSTVVALGGGVVGDLAGFAAATYLRGVRWVAAPTSLLAMADASLGGKTGADLPQGKNLIGAFHPPTLVLADPHTLLTLPLDEQCNGLAEVVKHGIIADPDLFELCSRGLADLRADWDAVVRRAMAVKVRVIEEDPYEKGRRASLNLGHTLGHAIELASSFKLKHGEAVAIGMVAAARLAEKSGLAQSGLAAQIGSTLAALGLPVEIPPGLDTQQVRDAMSRDKKRAGGKARLVLPLQIGLVRWGVEMADEDLLNAF
jgi:3-dehydroquinate synthase